MTSASSRPPPTTRGGGVVRRPWRPRFWPLRPVPLRRATTALLATYEAFYVDYDDPRTFPPLDLIPDRGTFKQLFRAAKAAAEDDAKEKKEKA